MILKQRQAPPELFQLESLLKRLPPTHTQFPHWSEKLRRISAGYHGEQRIDSLWHEIDIPIPHYFIHDLFIQKQQSSHQIDTLLITSHFILILEVKSISGLLHFDVQTRQFSRTNKDGSIDGLRNPDDQVRRHEKWIEQFLTERKIKLPVIGAIVFTYPSAVIQSRAGKRIMIQSSGLPFLMDQLLKEYPREILSKALIKKLSGQLTKLHLIKPLSPLILPSGLLTGVLCSRCEREKMFYKRKNWFCNICLFSDPHAHLDALKQYRSLFGSTISNREFRAFTGISSVSAASKLLAASKMAFEGSFKDRVYHIPEDFLSADSILPS
ncbi:nuclease-related domain-containing protein [Planococcus shenhongbingii]|uniref:nuclease-related domain-containing protein n=1 Tax=Planococcus shenhongbingii TaxID=3058398 RepID=UPI0026351A83|nr:nuclease-related domain-containing protein [Planococcus sp. N016]WKA57952.1 nuclease-related domain-containing protein [Planococcus sp. N016]